MKSFSHLLLAFCTCIGAINSNASTPLQDESEFRALYQELIEINTTLSVGSCTEAAEAMAKHLGQSGIPDSDIHVIVPPDFPTQGNLVAKLPGTLPDSESLLLLAHIDVVEANLEDWERDPFKLVEEDGYFFARGAVDDKSMAAIFVDIMKRLSRDNTPLRRSVVLALTCGEETPNTFNGASYLIKHHRDLITAKFALNEGGGGLLADGRVPLYNGIQAGEKTYQDYRLEVMNPGGHSSRPRPDNAIYQLNDALKRVSAHSFPIEFNDTTRGFFRQRSTMETGQVSRDMLAILETPPDESALKRIQQNPGHNSSLHTTCITTMVQAGHAPNALPQRATANVNCRIFPGHTQEEIRQVLETVVNDVEVKVTFVDPPETTSPPPPLTDEILKPIQALTEEMWPGVPVLPRMASGGTDGRFLTPAGIPTYGVSGLFTEPGEVNAHGLNEKVLVKSLLDSRIFLDRLVKIFAAQEP
jgi:acetylornithine deacetylase/succinyl-diaminopimelate desuccinylase-like protein